MFGLSELYLDLDFSSQILSSSTVLIIAMITTLSPPRHSNPPPPNIKAFHAIFIGEKGLTWTMHM